MTSPASNEYKLLQLKQYVAREAAHRVLHLGKPDKTKSGNFFGTSANERTKSCQLCNSSSHFIWQCKQFLSLDIANRWAKAKELGLCFRCLGGKHLSKSCSRTLICGIDGCKANHNRLLHESKSTTNTRFQSSTETQTVSSHASLEPADVKTHTTMSSLKDKAHFIALRTVPVVLKSGNRRLVVNAVLDDASSQTYINEDVASELGMTTVSVNVVNNRTESFHTVSVECD